MSANEELQAALRSIGSAPLFSSGDSDDDEGNAFLEDLRNEYLQSPECAGFFSWFCQERGATQRMPSDEACARRNQQAVRLFIKRKLREFGIPEKPEEE